MATAGGHGFFVFGLRSVKPRGRSTGIIALCTPVVYAASVRQSSPWSSSSSSSQSSLVPGENETRRTATPKHRELIKTRYETPSCLQYYYNDHAADALKSRTVRIVEYTLNRICPLILPAGRDNATSKSSKSFRRNE